MFAFFSLLYNPFFVLQVTTNKLKIGLLVEESALVQFSFNGHYKYSIMDFCWGKLLTFSSGQGHLSIDCEAG